MRKRIQATLATTVLALAFLPSCESGKVAPPPPSPSPSAEAVYIIFEGPWAIVPDPNDSKVILAIAPKTASHRPLAVTPANAHLDPGVYDLAIPDHGAPAAAGLDEDFYRTAIDPKNVQHAVDSKAGRYVVRLPRPEEYRAETKYRSTIGETYPPDPEKSKPRNYVTAVSLVYHVASKAGFSIAGTKDVGGAYNPLLLSLDTPAVRFEIEPAGEHADDPCELHSREAFRDLVRLLGLKLFLDFPEAPDPDKCHKIDPQRAGATKSEVIAPQMPQTEPAVVGNMVGTLGLGMQHLPLAMYVDRSAPLAVERLAAAIYFFHSEGGACMAPILFGGS